jgi:hypothetical protein
MLTTPGQPPSESWFDPAYPGRVTEPGDDAGEGPSLPGEKTALEELLWSWGEVFEIGVDDGTWWYRRRDGQGTTGQADNPDDLRAQMARDYCLDPAPRPPSSSIPPGQEPGQ